MPVTENGLEYTITQEGTGPAPQSGDRVAVHYRGTFTDGRVFDSSYDRGEPLVFNVDRGEVIAGWDQGIMLLREGSKATLTIPPELGYGQRGAGGVIPPNATLVFDVELVKVNP